MVTFRPSWVRAVLLGAICAIAVGAFGSTPMAAARTSACTQNTLRFTKVFWFYGLEEGVGLASTRDQVDVVAWDRCDHGWLQVTLSVYDAAIDARGGEVSAWGYYATSYTNGWSRSGMSQIRAYHHVQGWTQWQMTVRNVGLTSAGRITHIHLYTWMTFGSGVPGYSRYIECNLVQHTCAAGSGY